MEQDRASVTEVTLSGTGTLPSGQRLFGPVTLRLVSGGWTCLLGPSGCGKSTLLRILAGLETGVLFDGAVSGIGPDDVSYMAQSDLLLPWADVMGNVTLGARLRGDSPDLARAERLVARLGLEQHAHHRPKTLSGGQRQRVALARTLMEDRPIVLLDEPFSALDAQTRADMQDLAAETLAGRTVLIVTHDPWEAARLGDQILVMSARALTAIAPPESAPIRAVDDPEVLRLQADLMVHLRGGR